MKTLYEGAVGAVLPWNSLDAAPPAIEYLPQQDIEICLVCRYAAETCENCDGSGNVTRRGRPRKELNAGTLRGLMKLRKCNREICQALGVSASTLKQAKKTVIQEEME